MALRWSAGGAMVAGAYLLAAILLTRNDGLGLAHMVVTLPWSLGLFLLPSSFAYSWLWVHTGTVLLVGLNTLALYALFGGWRRSPSGPIAG